ncbi:MAG TPA: hypothetical protein VGZ02_15240 [Candidatus Baltobacteraceae bacterium]|jgi:hypothetical protein|nr:hypothetical protein [Candidatus Baltobacteraceae bacterium]
MLAALAACRGGVPSAGDVSAIPQTSAIREPGSRHVGLGAVLNTKDGGQVFGFDIDRSGADGVLASAKTINRNGAARVSVETFDQDTGAITSSFAEQTGTINEYAVDGIFAGDIGLVTHFVTPKGQIFAERFYNVMNPVTAQKFTGTWTSPIRDVDVLQTGVNQTTSTSVLFAIELKNQDAPDLIVTDIAANTVSKVVHLDPNLFGGANDPQMGQYIAGNKAVIAISPDAGTVRGRAPINAVVDLKTGATTQFAGFNNGFFHAGAVNGLAVDPNTGIAATTTELNSQVEFYDVNKERGLAFTQLPCTGNTDQTTSGAGVAVDPVNKLFLVTEPLYACDNRQQSALVVYDETGKQIEVIPGFKFVIAEPAPAINPSKRMGWLFGPKFSQLQQFFY